MKKLVLKISLVPKKSLGMKIVPTGWDDSISLDSVKSRDFANFHSLINFLQSLLLKVIK